MPVTTIVDTKAALFDAISALAVDGGLLSGVQVFWGFPHSRMDKEVVMIGQVTTNQVAAAIGQQRRQEDYTVSVFISVLADIRENQRTVTERAYAIAEAISDLIRPHSTYPLDVQNVYTMQVTKTDLYEGVQDNGDGKPFQREAAITLEISCMARI